MRFEQDTKTNGGTHPDGRPRWHKFLSVITANTERGIRKEQNEVREWMQKNLTGDWVYQSLDAAYVMDFTDAVAFRLRWC